MTFLGVALISAAFLCSLVAGFLAAFAVVVMPGFAKLDDREFIRAFQSIDRVIQTNQPLFVLMWVGSVLAILTAAVLGFWQLQGSNRVLLIVSSLVYGLGVQLPTARINIPLNNALQRLDPGAMKESSRKEARNAFERPWNRWNVIRTVCAGLTSFLLLILLRRV